MMQRLQSLREEMMALQEEVAGMVVTETAGGGAVSATVTGERRLQSLQIMPEVVDPDDVEMLQDLIVAAVNSGLEQIDRAIEERMAAISGGLDIAGMGLR